MKYLIFFFFFSSLFISCRVKLPAAYYEKSLKEDTLTAFSRHIFFDKVINFRDIGGLKTGEGKTVKWGKFFRSDNLSALEKSEFARFNNLHIETVYDLRTESEIKEKEDNIPQTVHYVHFPTVKDKGDLLTQLKGKVIKGEISEEESIKLTLDLYRGSVIENLPAFKELVNKIMDSDQPVLYHCSAGKDRTGIVTALILSVLKVDRQTILNEYLLSNYYRRIKMEKMLGKAKLAKVIKPHLNLKVIENFMKVDAQYLNATFEVIDQKYGGMDQFVQKELGIDDQTRKLLISKLTY
jgi:protein-tyrosine phosphatase